MVGSMLKENNMDYEKEYKEALERARDYKNDIIHTELKVGENIMDYIFPELKESENEKIRKSIIELIEWVKEQQIHTDHNTDGTKWDDMIAWLEKQSKENMIKALRLEYEKGKADGLQEQRKEWTSEDLLNRNEIIDILQEYNRDDLINWLEKQESVGEIVERCKKSWYNEGKIAGMAEGLTDDEKYQQGWHDAMEKLCANSVSITNGNTSVTNAEVVSHPTVIDSDGGKCTTASTTIKPKFKVGDFIVNDYCMGRVIELTNDAYLLDTEQGIPFSYEHNVHLWSINDAKDGDIIYIKRYKDNSEWLLIFKKIKSQNNFIDVYDYYAFSTTTDNVYYSSVGCWGLLYDEDIVHPATKEQCNLLFAKMKEEGFEWDAEKKELKKIENKRPLLSDFFNSEYERGKADAIKESSWSEEDEYLLYETSQHLEELIRIDKAKHCACDVQYYQRDIDWLKSLKEKLKGE